MKQLLSTLAITAALTIPCSAQRASPHETVSATVGGAKISIEYGRPYAKGRKIMGGLVPYGQVWRTGADEATTLTTDADLQIGTLKVPKGTYGLFTQPGQASWQLIVNTIPKQWGAFKYDASKDLGRTEMKVSPAPKPVEQFTIAIEPAGNKGVIRMSWENTVATVDFSVAK